MFGGEKSKHKIVFIFNDSIFHSTEAQFRQNITLETMVRKSVERNRINTTFALGKIKNI